MMNVKDYMKFWILGRKPLTMIIQRESLFDSYRFTNKMKMHCVCEKPYFVERKTDKISNVIHEDKISGKLHRISDLKSRKKTSHVVVWNKSM